MFSRTKRQQLRRRAWWKPRRWKTRDYIVVLLIAFVVSFSAFSITFYLNADYLIAFISYLFSSKPKIARSQPFLLTHTGVDYQPRDFSGKSDSLRYDKIHHL